MEKIYANCHQVIDFSTKAQRQKEKQKHEREKEDEGKADNNDNDDDKGGTEEKASEEANAGNT